MTYTPQTWVDDVPPGTGTPLDAAHMNHIEAGVVAADAAAATKELPTVVNGQWLKGVAGAAAWAQITAADVSGLPAGVTLPVPTIWLSAGGMSPAQSNGPAPTIATFNFDVPVLDFDPNATEVAYANFPFPIDYNGGLQARFIWMSASANTGDVAWGIDGAALVDGSPLGSSVGTAQYAIDGNGGASQENVSAYTATITPNGTNIAGAQVYLRVFREAVSGSDTHTADARLIGVKLRYTRF